MLLMSVGVDYLTGVVCVVLLLYTKNDCLLRLFSLVYPFYQVLRFVKYSISFCYARIKKSRRGQWTNVTEYVQRIARSAEKKIPSTKTNETKNCRFK